MDAETLGLAAFFGAVGMVLYDEMNRPPPGSGAVVTPTRTVTVRTRTTSKKGFNFPALLELFMDTGLTGTSNTKTTTYRPNNGPAPSYGGGGDVVGKLLWLIGQLEAPAGYDQIYGGIRRQHYPPKPITQITVGAVLAWQDSIDHLYQMIKAAIGAASAAALALGGLLYDRITGTLDKTAETLSGVAVIVAAHGARLDAISGRVDRLENFNYGD